MYSKTELNSMTKESLQDLVDQLGLDVEGSGREGQVLKVDLVEAIFSLADDLEEETPEPELAEGEILVDVKVPWLDVKEGNYRREFESAGNPHRITEEEWMRLERTKLFTRR